MITESQRQAQQKYRSKPENKIKARERKRLWRNDNKSRQYAVEQAWKARNREKVKLWCDVARYRRLLGGVDPSRPRPLKCENLACDNEATCMDHCHKKAVFRGWLCRRCNLALGHAGDNEEGVAGLLEYLRKFKSML